KLATLVNVGSGAAVVVANIAHRPELDANLGTALAHREGGQLIAIVLLAGAGVGLAQVGIALAERHADPPAWLRPTRRNALRIITVGLLAGAAIFAVAHGPRTVERQWQAFKNPQLGLQVANQDSFQRFGATSGNGRYQYWQSALDAAASHPWGGTGPGTFEFWWAAHGSYYSVVRNAHSLFFETLAETGFVGLGLLVLALGLLFGRGIVRAVGADPERGLVLAAVVGGGTAFLVSAGVDWVWQLPAVVAAFLVLCAIGAGPAGAGGRDPEAGAPRGQRRLLAGVAVVALAAIAVPLAAASDLRASQAQAAGGRLGAALDRAAAAHAVEPYAAGPELQRALVLELERRFPAAAVAAAAATRAAPTDWR
ncbi:MAG TPA: O-antigen ligase family protein, partial [Solirubrobacteraceae bacterium]|nr:O-antigen ligase family protein [Solirubrobacteraceae bacterium]